MLEKKYKNSIVESIDEKQRVVKLSVAMGCDLFDSAKEAISILKENPNYVGVTVSIRSAEYLITKGMSFEEFKEKYEDEHNFYGSVSREALAKAEKTPERKEMIKLEIEKRAIDDKIKALMAEKDALTAEWNELDKKVSKFRNDYINSQMTSYHNGQKSANQRRIDALNREENETENQSQPE